MIPEKEWKKLLKTVPMAVVDGIILKDKAILLVERTIDPFKGFLAIPGGFVDYGETVEKAVVREIWEETGLRTKPVRLVGVYSDPKRDPRGQTISTVFLMNVVGGKLRGSDETKNVKFYPLNKLPRLAFDHKKIINDALKLSHSKK